MKKIDFLALIVVIIGVMLYLRKDPEPSGSGSGNVGEGSGQAQNKIVENSESVLGNLDDQLDKFAEELAEDVNGVAHSDPSVKGFQGKIPDAYVPKNLAPFTTKEKLMDDLNYRLNRFGHDAEEEQNAYAKTHDIKGSGATAYRELLARQNAQKREIMDRHKEILKEFTEQQKNQHDLR
jgi:hypothetical protein